ncbi:MAG: YciI family protein [Saprospiraceae bacterium]
MKEFMLIFRGADEGAKNFSPEQMQAQLAKWGEWLGGLAAQGKLTGGQQLLPVGKVVSGTAKKVTDGPFAEGKELMGGYVTVKADSEAEVLQYASTCPALVFEEGSVEVREILQAQID